MAEDLDDIDVEEGEDAEGEGGAPGKKGSKKMLFLIIGIAILVVIGGVAGAWFTGLLDPVIAMVTGTPKADATQGKDGAGAPGEPVFLDLPEILVNLNTGGRKATYLKMRVSLELQNPLDVPKVEGQMTRVMDTFNVFLRELRIEDLKGSAGMYRLREELLARVSTAVAPIPVNDILFKEMLVN
jgi:flagellar FliL protein